MSSNNYKITLLGKEYYNGKVIVGDLFEISDIPIYQNYYKLNYFAKNKRFYTNLYDVILTLPIITIEKESEIEFNLIKLLSKCKKTFESEILNRKQITEDQMKETIKINDKEFTLKDNICYSNGNLKITVEPSLLTYDVSFSFHDINYSCTCYKLFDLEKQLNKIYASKVKPKINEYIQVLEKDIKAFEDEIESINELIGGYDIFL